MWFFVLFRYFYCDSPWHLLELSPWNFARFWLGMVFCFVWLFFFFFYNHHVSHWNDPFTWIFETLFKDKKYFPLFSSISATPVTSIISVLILPMYETPLRRMLCFLDLFSVYFNFLFSHVFLLIFCYTFHEISSILIWYLIMINLLFSYSSEFLKCWQTARISKNTWLPVSHNNNHLWISEVSD